MLGNEDEGRTALIQTMPEWLKNVTAADRLPLRARLPQEVVDGGNNVGARAPLCGATRDSDTARPGARLPEGNAWLRSYNQRHRVADQFHAAVSQGESGDLLPAQLAEKLSDLSLQKGYRYNLVRFVDDLLSRRDTGPVTAVSSGARRALLQALLRQPTGDTGTLQNKILDVVGKQLLDDRLSGPDKAAVDSTLAEVIGQLGN